MSTEKKLFGEQEIRDFFTSKENEIKKAIDERYKSLNKLDDIDKESKKLHEEFKLNYSNIKLENPTILTSKNGLEEIPNLEKSELKSPNGKFFHVYCSIKFDFELNSNYDLRKNYKTKKVMIKNLGLKLKEPLLVINAQKILGDFYKRPPIFTFNDYAIIIKIPTSHTEEGYTDELVSNINILKESFSSIIYDYYDKIKKEIDSSINKKLEHFIKQQLVSRKESFQKEKDEDDRWNK
jgi:hypothetical protein